MTFPAIMALHKDPVYKDAHLRFGPISDSSLKTLLYITISFCEEFKVYTWKVSAKMIDVDLCLMKLHQAFIALLQLVRVFVSMFSYSRDHLLDGCDPACYFGYFDVTDEMTASEIAYIPNGNWDFAGMMKTVEHSSWNNWSLHSC